MSRAVTFDGQTCRWQIIDEAQEVRCTGERGAILAALVEGGKVMLPGGLADATQVENQNVHQLRVSMFRRPR